MEFLPKSSVKLFRYWGNKYSKTSLCLFNCQGNSSMSKITTERFSPLPFSLSCFKTLPGHCLLHSIFFFLPIAEVTLYPEEGWITECQNLDICFHHPQTKDSSEATSFHSFSQHLPTKSDLSTSLVLNFARMVCEGLFNPAPWVSASGHFGFYFVSEFVFQLIISLLLNHEAYFPIFS